MSSRIERNLRRKRRVRFKIKSKLSGDKKRLSLTKTNRHLYAQLIDDTVLHTLIAASTQESLFGEQYNGSLNKSNRDSAKILAKIFADRAKNKQLTSSIVFDRGCHRYCGVVKEFVESLREHGLEI